MFTRYRMFLLAPLVLFIAAETAEAQRPGRPGGRLGGPVVRPGGFRPGGPIYNNPYYGWGGYRDGWYGYRGIGYPYYGGYGLIRPSIGGYATTGYIAPSVVVPATDVTPTTVQTQVVIPATDTTPATVQTVDQPAPVVTAPATPSEPAPATLTVIVPEMAQVSFDGTASDQTGSERMITTDAIEPGATKTVKVKVMNGDAAPMEMPVQLHAGDKVTVDLRENR